uniref:Uncharacterized protein n=1 Tax=Oscillatoriales cyanobacterium SpSt-402 TaxID=2282168 RepID=A0A832GZK3_9CYAN
MIAQVLETASQIVEQIQVEEASIPVVPACMEEVDLDDLADMASDIDTLLKRSDRGEEYGEQLIAIRKKVELFALQMGVIKDFEKSYKAHLAEHGLKQIVVPIAS